MAGFGAGRGRPSPTNHRRAVSAAYYALFHAIIGQTVELVLDPAFTDTEERLRAARWVAHEDIKTACAYVVECAAVTTPTTTAPTKTGRKHGVWELFSTPAPGGRVAAVPSAVERIASAFVGLQNARHEADYDQLASFPKQRARRHVLTAENAVALLRANVGDPYLRRLLGLIAFRARRLP